MAKRIITKIGDVFQVKLENGNYKYFQYVANDMTQLNSSVIRVFKQEHNALTTNFEEMLQGEIEFYAHCVLAWGIKMELWEKVGKWKEVGTDKIYFRCSRDSGVKIDGKLIEISERWFVWKINDEQFNYVGKLNKAEKKYDIGSVIAPPDLVHKINNGYYYYVYPKYAGELKTNFNK